MTIHWKNIYVFAFVSACLHIRHSNSRMMNYVAEIALNGKGKFKTLLNVV